MKRLKHALLTIGLGIGAFAATAATVEVTVNWPNYARENTLALYHEANGAQGNLVTTVNGGTNAMCVPGYCVTNNSLDVSYSQSYTFNDVPSGNYRLVAVDKFGDGWNGGGSFSYSVNGSSSGPFTVNGTGGFISFTINDPSAPTATQTCSTSSFTSSWANLGSSPSSSSGGVPVSLSVAATSPATWAAFTTDNMNTIDAWSSTAVQGAPAVVGTFNWDPTPDADGGVPIYSAVNSDGTANITDPGGMGTFQFNFGGRTVNNAIVHWDRLGGIGGGANSARLQLTTPGVSLNRLAGVGHFDTYANNSFYRQILVTTAGPESSLTNSEGTSAGSTLFSGEYSSLSFDVDGVGNEGAGADGFEIVVCVPQSDLSLTQTVNDDAPDLNENITFTLTVTNSGPDAAQNIQIRDQLPAEFDFDSATASQGSYDSGTGIWSVGSLANGATATLDIVAGGNTNGTFTNQAEIINADRVDPDSEFRSSFATDDLGDGIADDDETEVEVDIGLVDVEVTKTSSNDFVPGGTNTYTITVTNAGPSDANGLTVNDTFEPGITLDSAWTCSASAGSSCSAASGGSNGDTSVSLTVDVAAGGTVTVVVPVRYSEDPADY